MSTETQKPVDAGALTRAEKAKQGIRPVLNAVTGKPVESEVVSPLLPKDVEFDFDGLRYWLCFRFQDVPAQLKAELDAKRSYQALTAQKGLPEGLTEKLNDKMTMQELASQVTLQQFITVIRFQGSDEFRDEKIALYVPHVKAWNVPDENGEVAPFDVNAFESNRGVYDAALEALDAAFLNLSAKPSEETAKPEASSTAGDTPSSVPAKEPAIAESGASPSGTLPSN